MAHFKDMSRQDIEDSLEAILGSHRWASIKSSVHLDSVIENSASEYEAAELIIELITGENM